MGTTSPAGTAARTTVVGVDGSTGSIAALRWAVRHATGTVRAVHLWGPRAVTDLALATPAEVGRGSVCMLQNEIRAALHQAALEHVDGGGLPAVVPVSRQSLRPAHALVELAADADLLVLGQHERLDLSDRVLGGVTRGVLRTARCPVVVIGADGSVRRHEAARPRRSA